MATDREHGDGEQGESRERLLTAIEDWVAQILESGDLSPIHSREADENADKLARLIREDDGDLSARLLLGWLHWCRYANLPVGQDLPDLRAAIDVLAPYFFSTADLGLLPPPLLPHLADQMAPVAVDVLYQVFACPDPNLTDAAVEQWRRIMAATPSDHPDRGERLSNLGIILLARFEMTGNRADVDEAVQMGTEAMGAIAEDYPDRGAVVTNLWKALRAKVDASGAREDLDAFIRVGRQGLAAAGVDHAYRGALLAGLGDCLRIRFEQSGDRADIDEAVRMCRRAVTTTATSHPERGMRLANLGVALLRRFESVGTAADLGAAVRICRRSVAETATVDPDRGVVLSRLGHTLITRFEQRGNTADLEEAVRVGREAVATIAVDHHGRSGALSGLAISLLRRFEYAGETADLDEAVAVGRQAVSATAAAHTDRGGRLLNLAVALVRRFERTGASQDLDEAIAMGRQAVAATDAGYSDSGATLSNLAVALVRRFERAGSPADLEDAIRTSRLAVAATGRDHSERGDRLSNLGASLLTWFEHTGVPSDLDEAIQTGRQALALAPAGHPERGLRLSNLGNAVLTRFEQASVLSDLDEAIQLISQAVLVTAEDNPHRGARLSNLGNALLARSDRSGTAVDFATAVDTFAQAARARSTPPSIRIRAARTASRLIAYAEPARAAGLLDTAVRLLPTVAPRELARTDQQYALGGYAGLAADAAALTLRASTVAVDERPEIALQLLETGRAVLLGQAIHVRGDDIGELVDKHPQLADRFIALRDRLDRPSVISRPSTVGSLNPGGGRGASSQDPGVLDVHESAREFENVLAQIRAVDGFSSFARPPSPEQLLAETAHGPIVMFNISEYRCDALLLTSEGVTGLPLLRLTADLVTSQALAFQEAVAITRVSSSFAERLAAQQELTRILEWMWDNAMGPVLDALGYTEPLSPKSSHPRVWWIPGGLLGQLPLHAAGYHTTPPDPGARTVMDRVVSSYTPTISALRHARQHESVTGTPATSRALIVAMPTTPGVPGRLNNVDREVEALRGLLPDSITLTEPDLDDLGLAPAASLPTKANVVNLLAACPIAHFACHGLSDPRDPSRSLLLLHDHNDDPLTVESLTPVHLEHARLAYLSACETALTKDARLIDEAIHLATAFQLAGYPHVIGTQWTIDDTISSRIASSFYIDLDLPNHRGTALDISSAAKALHKAVRAERNRFPRTPSLWAAHLHAGA